jgi:phosphatidylglycerophosphate synthase
MLGAKFREKLRKPLEKIGLLMAKTGINPNVFSSFAFLWAIIAAYFIANENMTMGLVFVIITAIWDALDGSLARAEKKVTKFGNYLDAMIDRHVEIIIYLGFALSGFFIEAFLVVSGSLLVSYAKARTALVVPIDNHDWPAIGERPDRLILLVISMIITIFLPEISALGATISSMSFFLYLIAIMVYVGSIQRILYARKIIKKG